MEKILKNSMPDEKDAVILKQTSIFSKLKWWFASVFAVVMVWAPFHGYTTLLSKLQSYGFEGASIDPTTYELYLYFLEGMIKPFEMGVAILNNFGANLISLDMLYFSLLVGSLVVFVSFIPDAKVTGGTEGSGVKSYGLLERLSLVVSKAFEKAKTSKIERAILFIKGACVGPVVIGLWNLLLLLVLLLFAFFLMISISGMYFADKYTLENHLYVDPEAWVDVNDDTVNELDKVFSVKKYRYSYSCVRMNNAIVKAKRIYSDKNSSFYINESGSYQVNSKGNVVFFRPLETSPSLEFSGISEKCDLEFSKKNNAISKVDK